MVVQDLRAFVITVGLISMLLNLHRLTAQNNFIAEALATSSIVKAVYTK